MNTIKLWRELKYGMQGAPDVKAAQRGLWRLLGDADSTNARNGNYGEETANDVHKARARLGMNGSSKSIGATLYAALQEYFDAPAWQAACEQPDAVKSAPPTCKRLPLKKGMTGKDIQGAQRALWRALQGDSTNARNGNFGDETCKDIARFRDRYAVNPGQSNARIGADLWNVLTRWMDQLAVDQVHEQPEPKPPVASSWEGVSSEAWWAYQNKGRFLYSQTRPMPKLHDPPIVYSDCSGLYTMACQSAGVPNPNRADGVYDGYGYTGTLVDHGYWTSSPKAGDCALYGSSPAEPTHCAVYLGDGTVVSFGSDPIKHLDVTYRYDLLGIRSYR